jgi:hypothetical protein
VHRASTADTLAIEFNWMGIYNFDRNAFITTTHYDFLVKNLGIQLQLQLHIKVCKSKKKKKEFDLVGVKVEFSNLPQNFPLQTAHPQILVSLF